MFYLPELPKLTHIQENTIPVIERHYEDYEDYKISEFNTYVKNIKLNLREKTVEIISILDAATSALSDNITSNQNKKIIDDYIDELRNAIKSNTNVLKNNIIQIQNSKTKCNGIKGKNKGLIISALTSIEVELIDCKNLLEDISDKIKYLIKIRASITGIKPEYQLLQAYKAAIKKITGADIEPKQFGNEIFNEFTFEIPYSVLQDTGTKNRFKITDKIHDLVLTNKNVKYSSIVAIRWINIDNDNP